MFFDVVVVALFDRSSDVYCPQFACQNLQLIPIDARTFFISFASIECNWIFTVHNFVWFFFPFFIFHSLKLKFQIWCEWPRCMCVTVLVWLTHCHRLTPPVCGPGHYIYHWLIRIQSRIVDVWDTIEIYYFYSKPDRSIARRDVHMHLFQFLFIFSILLVSVEHVNCLSQSKTPLLVQETPVSAHHCQQWLLLAPHK